jgi:hypothetical protein
MSNWKACIPANPKYEGAMNLIWVTNVSVVPNESASIKVQVQYQNGALANEFITIGGDEYKEWAADDNWIYHKVARKLALGALAQGTTFPEPLLVPERPPSVAAYDDNRSVHNEADIAKIQTLEEQMIEQTRQLQQMRQIMISKGMI